jgi:hypothetical protein
MSIDIVNKWLSAGANVAVISGIIAAGVGVTLTLKSLRQTQATASATLVLTLRDALENDRYASITREIENNPSSHPIRRDKGGKIDDLDVERYLGNFEDIGYLVDENVLIPEMAYHHFSYDVEKAWCNADIRALVAEARKGDKSAAATTDPFYGNLQRLAERYLRREHQDCGNLENQ